MTKIRRIILTEQEMPRQWYNLAADVKCPPFMSPGGPVPPEAWAPVFPMNLVEQEYSTQRWIDIPEEVLSLLTRWRPAPMHRAYDLERALGTPARIYYKNESLSPGGSHKPNTAVAQAWYNKQAGTKRLTTETGAGQWGSALAFACSLIGLECKVFMVRVSYGQKPLPKLMMQTWGAQCVPSPSMETQAGRAVLEQDPDTPGSLGIAISEAIEAAVSEKLPDIVIGCAGGGSNFACLSFPFVYDKIHGSNIEIIPVEPASCPTLTRGHYVYDHGDNAKMTPLVAMHSLGHNFIPAPIHAGGLRYHGMSPLVSRAVMDGLMSPRAINQIECYEAGMLFARTEGIIPAPESCHAIAATIQEAKKAKEEGKEKVILFNLSGHGLFDLLGYEKFMAGQLVDYELPQEIINKNHEALAGYPMP
ncbi:MAG: TrpB-like pyridoxal-phosphate dependent enzyme [Bacteroidia bacterium]|nr:TrpB-like pyridoxal-phosphate dependent enzyme [Bacteroidia bacterium]